jgi:hypothetical protein
MSDSKHYFSSKGAIAEEVVNDLALKSFFADWCYLRPPLPHGKELCDLFVVFDNVAIIWQVKDLKLQENGLYSRKDVEKNLRQLSGAHRRLMDEKRPVTMSNPRRGEEIFELKSIKETYLISVLLGEGEKFFSPMEAVKEKLAHVFTREFLGIVLNELDTVVDFVEYLRAKEELLGHLDRLLIAGGEKELLAFYLKNGRSFDQLKGNAIVIIEEGTWADLLKRPEYLAKQEADKISYGWDSIIDRAHEAAVPEYERVARELARTDRFTRRCLAKSFFDAHIEAHEVGDKDVFRRVMAKDGITYCFLFMDDPEPREFRKAQLAALCFVARGKIEKNPHVIGIATEKTIQPECSYDFCYLEMPEWTAASAAEAAEIQRNTGLLTNAETRAVHEDEYPA